MSVFGYLRVALFSTVNIVLNGATLGRHVWLEGKVNRGVFTNWARRFRYAPKKIVKPTTEQEIVELIRNARSVRVLGSGHSFNAGVVSDETLVSLDDYGVEFWSNLILESNKAFNRTIYHLHQELEFTVPFEDTFEASRRFIGLYEEMYYLGLRYALFEVRFTPKQERTLIGAGRDRRCTWIDLVCNDSPGFEKYYAAAEQIIKEIEARPHLGKFCETIDEEYLARLHQNSSTKFLELVGRHDPDGKFANDFTRRLFGRGP
jgi:hypothetical protein